MGCGLQSGRITLCTAAWESKAVGRFRAGTGSGRPPLGPPINAAAALVDSAFHWPFCSTNLSNYDRVAATTSGGPQPSPCVDFLVPWRRAALGRSRRRGERRRRRARCCGGGVWWGSFYSPPTANCPSTLEPTSFVLLLLRCSRFMSCSSVRCLSVRWWVRVLRRRGFPSRLCYNRHPVITVLMQRCGRSYAVGKGLAGGTSSAWRSSLSLLTPRRGDRAPTRPAVPRRPRRRPVSKHRLRSRSQPPLADLNRSRHISAGSYER